MKEPVPANRSLARDASCVDIPLPSEFNSKWHSLNFDNEIQEQSHWCWAAVSASVAHFYKTAATQCGIANGELSRSDCCEFEPSDDSPCNVRGFLMSALLRVGHFRDWAVGQSATEEQMRDEIDHSQPLCPRIVWFGGGAHFVTIVGYVGTSEPGVDNNHIAGLAVADPFWGLSDIDYADFPRSGSNWTDTYYTKA